MYYIFVLSNAMNKNEDIIFVKLMRIIKNKNLCTFKYGYMEQNKYGEYLYKAKEQDLEKIIIRETIAIKIKEKENFNIRTFTAKDIAIPMASKATKKIFKHFKQLKEKAEKENHLFFELKMVKIDDLKI